MEFHDAINESLNRYGHPQLRSLPVIEFFVVGQSFAAPFASDKEEKYIEGTTPARALKKYVAEYEHPMGLYFAALYEDADAYHKHKRPLYEAWSLAAEADFNDKERPANFKEIRYGVFKER